MKKYTKYEFIQNTNNKELNDLFEKPSYNDIDDKKNTNSLDEGGYAEINSLDIISIIAVIGMIISFLLFKVVS